MRSAVMIFGGSGGIGRAVSMKFLENNFKLVLLSRREDFLRQICQDLRRTFGCNEENICGIPCSVTDDSSVQNAVKYVEQQIGPIHSVINAAGINVNKLLIHSKEGDIRNLIDTNLIGCMITSKAVLHYMIKRKFGNIINIGSIVGMKGNVGQCSYSAAKSGLVGFTKSLAKEVSSRGIKVNLVMPGFIQTAMTSTSDFDKLREFVPLGRIGSPKEVAEAVWFLSKNSYVTGETIFVDGGLSQMM